MRTILTVSLLALTSQLSWADYTFTSGGGGDIPQMNPVGLVSVGTVSGSGSVSGMSLDLTVNGGFNGDLYAYLVAPNQTTVATLLGTVGGNFDQVGSGYNITLSSAGDDGINHVAQDWGTQLQGTYQPVVDLMGAFGSYLAAHGATGDWRLFLANQSNGGQSVLTGWNLTFITTAAVPEPEQVAAISLLGLIGLMAGSYRRWGRALGLKKL